MFAFGIMLSPISNFSNQNPTELDRAPTRDGSIEVAGTADPDSRSLFISGAGSVFSYLPQNVPDYPVRDLLPVKDALFDSMPEVKANQDA
jgi:hypothetical protein